MSDEHDHDRTPGDVDPDAERLGLSPHARRPAPLGLALAGGAAVVGVFSVLEGPTWLAVAAYPVVFLGGLMSGAGWPGGR